MTSGEKTPELGISESLSTGTNSQNTKANPRTMSSVNDEHNLEEASDGVDEDVNYEEETIFKKIAKSIKKSSISELLIEKHHELRSHNEDEIRKLTTVVRNKNGDVIDELHKTTPIMTKYEKTRVLGQRCRQLENGAIPLVDLSKYDGDMLDDLFIAKLELEQRKLPFIIRRPLPNGSSEYWKVGDLEMI